MSGATRWLVATGTALLLPLLTAFASSAPASAYVGQTCPQGTISANPTVGNGGDIIDVTVTITNCTGEAIGGVLVVFSQASGPANCQLVFNPPQAVTDSNGQVHTSVTLPRNCPCQYTIVATAASVNITLTTTVRENGCLPFTSADRPAASVAPDTTVGLLAVALAALLGGLGGFALWRGRTGRL